MSDPAARLDPAEPTAGPAGPAPSARPAPRPDPEAFEAVAVRNPRWLTGASWRHAADDGLLVGGRARAVAGLGAAAVLALPHGLDDPGELAGVVAWLAAVPRRPAAPAARPPSGRWAPVAMGAFPFDRGAPARLVVPTTAWWRDPATTQTWAVHVVPRGQPAPADLPVGPWPAPQGGRAGPAEPGATAQTLATGPDPAYEAAVSAALDDIAGGRLRKVVLARALRLPMDPPAAAQVLDRLCGADPSFFAFSVPVPGGRLVGASPELLVSRIGRAVVSHAFAGTVALGGTDDDDQAVVRLAASAKDRAEHRLVVDEIARALRPRTVSLDVPATPSVVRLRSDARLGTLLSGRLRPGPGGRPLAADSALGLLAAVHPTPAVAGVPRQAALEHIARLEAAPRGYWAGAAGWVDASGDGEWILTIRSAVLGGGVASVHAGAGVVEGSVPSGELHETAVKLSPVLAALQPQPDRPR